ncbi:MAG: hypothetical protein IPN61_00935 [Bacteroidetes bacterium]|nr:hypothetical protein [Bacteroidota bacterium]
MHRSIREQVSTVSLTLQFTLPYSLFNDIDYRTATDAERYKFIEYHNGSFLPAGLRNLQVIWS